MGKSGIVSTKGVLKIKETGCSNMNFKENLTQFRKQAGMSQEDLADKLQLTRQTISKWENGLSEPDLATLQQLCTLLQVSPDELLLGKKKEAPVPVPEKKQRATYEIFFYIFLIVIFIAAVATLNSERSVLTRQRQAIYVMGGCVAVFLLIGLVKGAVRLVRIGIRMLQDKKK